MIDTIISIDLTGVKNLTIPEGVVKRISVDGIQVWESVIDETMDFPDLYQRVEYIATEGTSSDGWIETDFIGNNESGIELIASYPTALDRVSIGTRVSSSTDSRFYGGWLYSTSRFCFGWNKTQTITKTFSVNTIYGARTNFLNDRYARVYTEEQSIGALALSGTLVQQTSPVTIFRYSRPDGYLANIRVMKLYSVKLSQGNEIVREYIPCYRKSDGEVGLWEVYTEQFLTSAGGEGTGFTKGADVDWDVQLFAEPVNMIDDFDTSNDFNAIDPENSSRIYTETELAE